MEPPLKRASVASLAGQKPSEGELRLIFLGRVLESSKKVQTLEGGELQLLTEPSLLM